MITIELTPEEHKTLREFLEVYHHNLQVEIAHTDDREFRNGLKEKEAVMKSLIKRLN